MLTIENPRQPAVQAIFLRAHLRMLQAGMRNSRFRVSDLMARAGELTGKVYNRRAYAVAIEDLTLLINTTGEAQ